MAYLIHEDRPAAAGKLTPETGPFVDGRSGGFTATGAGHDKPLHSLDAHTAVKTTWLDLS
ncbi:hypothetical protein AB0K15_07330 [Amycolatopsis sp. NPDC049253]|uniref:hypothetical protein n=1 Tax=Amycolatopsis sp. NPDC049253 TaxID=3155274 RepID=UPI00343A3CD9